MPGNTKRRRRKHRGTQTGSLDRRGRTGRARNRQEAMSRARSKGKGGGGGGDRRTKPPNWRSATLRGVFFAALLFPVSMLFGQPVGNAVILALIAAVFYVPLGYYTDSFFYNRRMAKLEKEKLAKKAERQGGA